jgi:O-antigen/teichoic acid export membrane protein
MDGLKARAITFLRSLERYTKTDMVYVAKGSFWLFSWQIFNTIFAFILSVIFANTLSKDNYGIYKYIISISGLVNAFSLTGSNTAVTRAVALGLEGEYRRSIIRQLKWSGPVIILSFGISLYYWIHGNALLAVGAAIVGLISPVITTSNTFTAFLNGKKDYKKLSIYNSYLSIITTVPLIVTVFFTHNPLVLATVYFSSTAIGNTIFILQRLKNINQMNLLIRQQKIMMSTLR